MQWYDVLLELIDFRSFSSLWYWLALSAMWSGASHWVLGVPYDMVRRTRRDTDGTAQRDLEDLLRVNVTRILHIARESGLLIVAGLAFILTALLVLAVGFGMELAQAVLFLMVPALLVYALSLRLALRLERGDYGSADLDRVLTRHRMIVQTIGMFAIFFTAIFGMIQNIRIGAL